MKDTEFRRAHFLFWSRRLVKEIFQQYEATSTRVRASANASIPGGPGINVSRDRVDPTNEFALIRSATKLVKEITGPISDFSEWNDYLTGKLDVELGVVCVHAGWEGSQNKDIAAMRAVLPTRDGGAALFALFGSAFNYRALNGNEGGLAERPSDVDGLYLILDRTLEPSDPKISIHALDREIGHSSESRASQAESLLDGSRFKPFRAGSFEVLIKVFARVEMDTTDYETIVLGTPIWVAELPVKR